uniref:GGDEF domain-containing protein n=1 Tax=uncultured Erythrobacter sp. TaxID=263913 RepID=UPI0026189197|nr:GGDEF domain-containing protein [uncultured Erythrobacter sp.]
MQTQILGLLTPLMALLFAATFAVFWRAGGMKRHVLGFAIGYLLFALGFLATHFLPSEAVYLFHTTQALYSLGVIVYLASLCERAGQKLHISSQIGVYIISAAVLALAVSMTNDVGPRLIIVNMGYGVMCAMGLTTLLTAPRRTVIDTAIIVVVAIQAADFVVRPNLTLMFEKTIPAADYRDSIYYSLIGLVLGVKSVAAAMVLIGATIAELTTTLRESSERDDLTGLHNRGSFEQSMRSLLPRAQIEGRPLSLVVADIDHFKQVNDIWGHQSGDHAIAGFAEIIENMVRGCDVSGRIGGEEFCIAVWNCDNRPAERLAERIRQSFAHLEHEGLNDDIRLTASFGVATAQDGETYEDLFARADAALYQAKSNGRDRVENAERPRAPEIKPHKAPEIVELRQAASDR